MKEFPLEACGVLGGTTDGHTPLALTLYPMKNILSSQVRFRMDPLQQFQVFKKIDASKMEMVGIYHSHPTGPDTPSIIDIKEAYYPNALYLIWSFKTGEWRLFVYKIRDGDYQEIIFELTK